MDGFALLRMFGALGLVLGLLFAALWLVRRFNFRLPGSGGGARRLELVERTQIDPKRSLVLVRRDGREHLLLISPDGHVVIEHAIRPDAADRKAQARRESELLEQRREQEAAIAAARDELGRRGARLVQSVVRTGHHLANAAPGLPGRFRIPRPTEFARLVESRSPAVRELPR